MVLSGHIIFFTLLLERKQILLLVMENILKIFRSKFEYGVILGHRRNYILNCLNDDILNSNFYIIWHFTC